MLAGSQRHGRNQAVRKPKPAVLEENVDASEQSSICPGAAELQVHTLLCWQSPSVIVLGRFLTVCKSF